jgi:hypothetical protein
MATQKEIGKYCRDKKFYEKATKSLSAMSDFSIFIDGDLDKLQAQAKSENLEFFILKGELKKTSKEDKI